ncbi:hypothetical protein DXN05_15360 [Deminuibacter soli]|uniref:Polysaccharide biosynthesis protein C-terminal domain-containing protein n=2 Tax=Deminuibacter soli TaxID=2291815 RepID=A0A3E1NHI8_9BACT|nr:hypothetical protein DXN05_15360 [Deminuibacter soli]
MASYIPAFILFVLTFVQSIVLVPVFLQYWGSEKYSVWLTLYAFITLMRTLDLGHQNYIGNEFSKLYHSDKRAASGLLGSSVRVALLLGVFELLVYVVICLCGYHKSAVGIDLQQYHVSDGIIAFLIMWLLTGSVGGLITRMLYPVGKYSVTNYFGLLIKVGELVAILVGVYLKLSINQLCIVVASTWFVYNAYTFIVIRRIMPDFFPWWKDGSWKAGFNNLKKSVVLTFNGFIEQFNTNGLILLVSHTAGLLVVPVFTTVRTVGNTFMQVSNLMLNPLAPELVRYYVKGEKEKIIATIEANWFITGLIINVPVILILPFLEFIYTWWTKGKLPFNPVLLYTILLSIAVVNSGKSFVTVLTSINELKSVLIITICRFILTYGFSILLLKYFGLSGLGVSMLAAEVVSSGYLPANFVYKLLGLKANILQNKMRLLSILQIILLGAVLFAQLVWPGLKVFIFAIGFITTISISLLQWKGLDADVRKRLISLVRKK